MANKAVAVARQSFDKVWTFRRIAQRFTKLVDSGVDAVVEVDKSVGRPEPLPQFLSRNDFARFFQEEGQDLQGPFLQLALQALLAQFSCAEIQLEGSPKRRI